MKYRKVVGKIHLGFFDYSHIFKKTTVIKRGKGEVVIQSPFFSLRYDYNKGVLSSDDKDVLLDFVDMIKVEYGTRITRDEFKEKVKWGGIKRDFCVLNVGVCVLDTCIGWDGTVNSIWFDAQPPGEVVNLYFQYWNKKMLVDAWKLNMQDVCNLGGVAVVYPNLLDSLKYIKDNKKEKVLALLNEIS